MNTRSISGFDGRTDAHAGSIRLVTPTRVRTNAVGTLFNAAVLDLTFVPELGTLVLVLVAGLAVAIGRRRHNGV